MSKNLKPRNVSEAMLLHLKKMGVDYFFANPGTEFVSVIRGFHDLPQEAVPLPILAPHEFQAIGMAYGCFLSTKRPQAVMTHANVGAANALIGLIGASRMNIPLIFISGMTSQSERTKLGHRDKLIHWSQDSKDHASIYRAYVKLDIEVRDPASLLDILDRAYAVAMSEPCGPVAICISRDLLMDTNIEMSSSPAQMVTLSQMSPEPKVLAEIFKFLHFSKKPLIITNRVGLDEGATLRLSEIASQHEIGVVTPEDFYLSLPVDHANHLGFHHGAALTEADLVLVLDTEAPWFPIDSGPNNQAKVVHVGPDPLFENIPLRSHHGNIFLRSNLRIFLDRLSEEPTNKELLEGRREWIHSKRQTPQEINGKDLDAASVSSVISEFLDADTILINELGLKPQQLKCQFVGSYFRSGSASPLGWGVSCALGIAFTQPKKTVIACVGDGVFYLSPILSTLLVAAEADRPLIIIVLNNGGLQSIANTVNDFYPQDNTDLPLTKFSGAGIKIEKCADFASGLGICATNTDELKQAIFDAKEFCQTSRRSVVINTVFSNRKEK